MKLDVTRPVNEIVAAMPSIARVLEKFGIDFCCDGKQSLEEACRSAGLPVDDVVRALEDTQSYGSGTAWDSAPLAAVMQHIIEKHHAFCRQELSRLGTLLSDAARADVGKSQEIAELQKCFSKMSAELLMHLVKEEQTLFPMMARMEEAASHQTKLPKLPFGTIENPIGMMVFEHDETGVDLRRIRKICYGFRVPAEASAALRALYEGLKNFEIDMHEHVFLENYILFPRAAALEKRATQGFAAP